MNSFRTGLVTALVATCCILQLNLSAQTNLSDSAVSQLVNPNSAIIPVPRSDWAVPRQNEMLARVKAAPGDYDLEFIGDSITQGWESAGKNVWSDYYGHRKAINLGVGGDRTQHVLWRFEHGQLDGLRAKVAIVLIGTNNSNNHDNTEAEILAGVTAVVRQIRASQPDAKILLLAIFPRGTNFSTQRGKILQVNEALARLSDGQHIFYLDIGSQLIGNDGAISPAIMPDVLHPNDAGYRIWAAAMEPLLKELLAQ